MAVRTQGNRYAAQCARCGGKVEAGAGVLTFTGGAGGRYTVTHDPKEWRGSPVSGGWVGGCPAEADRIPWEDRPARASRPARGSYGRRRGSGRTAYVRCTHEDYPCCGCER